MAAAHLLPSLNLQSHPFSFEPMHIKTEKLLTHEDHESEISKWLKLEEPLPPVVSNTPTTSSAFPSTSSSSFFSGSNASSNASSSFSPYPFSAPSSFASTQSSAPFSFNGNQYAPQFPQTMTTPQFGSQFANTFSPQFPSSNAEQSFSSATSNSPAFANLFQFPFGSGQGGNTSFDFTQQMTPPQLYQLFAQFQQILKAQGEELDNEKKRKKPDSANGKTFSRRVRQTRPKVVEAKGAVQCKGRNRKKGTQCRNAALMEYIGPRPVYCAEHIELDPKSLYEKCKSPFQKELDDNKGCKEVVLKEFGVCYKHYTFVINEILQKRDVERAKKQQERINDLLIQLEKDAAAAKKKDGDLYQRKNKLIPKFQEMKKAISKTIDILENRLPTSPASKLANDECPVSMESHHFFSIPHSPEIITAEELSPQSFLSLSDEDSVDSFTDVSD